jgi:hypothetical protein
MMTSFVRGLATAAALILGTCAANAQAAQTWVSGLGSDSNPCTRTAPCQTFANAASKTGADGQINALDPGDFGALTITKALIIDGGGGQVASVQVGGGSHFGFLPPGDIIVQAGPGDVVTIRNLRISGGRDGIKFDSGAVLNIENCYISGFANYAIDFVSAGDAKINISDTVVYNNNGGIRIAASGAGTVLGALLRVQMNNNSSFGLRAEGLPGATGPLNVSVTDSQASSSNNGIVAAGDTSNAVVIINGSTIVNNATNGLMTSRGAGMHPGVIVVGNSIIGGNGTGVNATAGGAIYTNGNNSLTGNFTAAGTFSGASPLQ